MKTRELISNFNVTVDFDEVLNLFTISGTESVLRQIIAVLSVNEYTDDTRAFIGLFGGTIKEIRQLFVFEDGENKGFMVIPA